MTPDHVDNDTPNATDEGIERKGDGTGPTADEGDAVDQQGIGQHDEADATDPGQYNDPKKIGAVHPSPQDVRS